MKTHEKQLAVASARRQRLARLLRTAMDHVGPASGEYVNKHYNLETGEVTVVPDDTRTDE